MTERSEWRPIAEAPRDGTPVILGMAGDFMPEICRWADDAWRDSFTDDVETQGFHPTHFMPLPDPPPPPKGSIK